MGKFIARFGDKSSVMAALNEGMFTFLSAADRISGIRVRFDT